MIKFNEKKGQIQGHGDCRPSVFDRQIIGRRHVGEKTWQIFLDLFPESNDGWTGYASSFRKGVLDKLNGKQLFHLWARSWNQHQLNRREYRQVMRGGKW